MTWRRLLIVFLLAAVTFGGTFTCKSNTDDGFVSSPTTSPSR